MATVNSKQVSFLMDILGGNNGAFVDICINPFGNFCASCGEISVYIEYGEYHLAIGNTYFNCLSESELINKLAHYGL